MKDPLALCLLAAVAPTAGLAPRMSVHGGPDPVAHWLMTASRLGDATAQPRQLEARLGPDAEVHGDPTVGKDELGEWLYLDGEGDCLVAGESREALGTHLPEEKLTLAAWVSVETPRRWGGIVSFVQDNGDAEAGWVLGYDEERFTFGLATQGADDGNGAMTYLRGTTAYEAGRLYHVVATYDGEAMRLYVNGRLEATDRSQSGAVLYPAETPLAIGSYWDNNERHDHHGRLREVAIYDVCATDKWVDEEFAHDRQLAAAPAKRTWPDELEFVVRPYLQFATRSSMTVMWETTRPALHTVWVGATEEALEEVPFEQGEWSTMAEVTIRDLEPGTPYVYRIESSDRPDRQLPSELRTFQTAVDAETPFAFAIISDTQGNPEVSGRIAAHAFGQRPHFALIPGDLVSTGTDKSHWTEHFFGSMEPLTSRVAFFPVLGNHEQDAAHYYRYASLPDPEYCYEFEYGNAGFFVIDSNRNVDPGSEQYRWLDEALDKSVATWKFVSYHHPSYSSDENDYGDMWKGRSTHGDLRVRQLTKLFDKHGVDVVWNGHIHSYERTWPVKNDRADPQGTIYMITGGGGGSLETPGPTRPFFQNTVRRGHHYCMVAIHGRRLEFKAYDLENRLFDTLTLTK